MTQKLKKGFVLPTHEEAAAGLRAYPALAFVPRAMLEEVIEMISRCDQGHQAQHILDVVTLADKLSQKLIVRERRALLLAALMHDVGCAIERARHEIISSRYAADWMITFWNELEMDTFIYKDTFTLIIQHRSSYKGIRETYLSELMRLADAGVPDVRKSVLRAILYRKETTSKEDNIRESYDIMKKKYGYEGYEWKRYPKLGNALFPDELKHFKAVVDDNDLLLWTIEEVAERIYG